VCRWRKRFGRNGQALKKVFRESQQLRKVDAEGTLPIKTVGEIKAVLFAGIESCPALKLSVGRWKF